MDREESSHDYTSWWICVFFKNHSWFLVKDDELDRIRVETAAAGEDWVVVCQLSTNSRIAWEEMDREEGMHDYTSWWARVFFQSSSCFLEKDDEWGNVAALWRQLLKKVVVAIRRARVQWIFKQSSWFLEKSKNKEDKNCGRTWRWRRWETSSKKKWGKWCSFAVMERRYRRE